MNHQHTRQKQGKRTRILFGLIALWVMLFLWICYENKAVGVTRLTVSDQELPDQFDGYTIAHISDLHNDWFGDNQSELVDKLKQENLDLIVITGDLIDARRTSLAPAMALLEQAAELAPVYYVTGNHEGRVYSAYQQLEKEMLAAGVHVLHQEGTHIERGGASLQLIGLDDPQFYSSAQTQQLEQLVDKNAYKLLLSHRPELFERYVRAGVNLVFCGHAHGGQIRIPFLGGVIAPNQGLFPAYAEGAIRRGQTTMVVSRGLGNSIFPVRINNPPELVMVTLRAEVQANLS